MFAPVQQLKCPDANGQKFRMVNITKPQRPLIIGPLYADDLQCFDEEKLFISGEDRIYHVEEVKYIDVQIIGGIMEL